jgi:hypothetical protein
LDFSAGAVTIEGADAESFTTSTFSTTQLAEDATAPLTVTFEPKENGLLTAILKIQSNDPANPSFTITLKGEGHTIIGVENTSDPTVVVYPNPSSGTFRIRTVAPVSEIVMTDASGRHVGIDITDGGDGETLVTGDPRPGIYILQMKIRNADVKKKVVILK